MKTIFSSKKVWISVIIVFSVAMFAVAQQDFEDYLKQDKKAFDDYNAQYEKEYEAYVKADREAFNNFKKDIEKKWGDFVESDRKQWVEYSGDKSTRTIVDFEKGETTVEVLVTPEEAKNTTAVENKVAKAVENLVKDKGKTKDYTSKVEKPKPLSSKPVLQNQLKLKNNKVVTLATAKQFAKEIIKSKPVQKKTVKGKDNKKRVKLTVKFNLVPDHIQNQAKKYEGYVYKYARKYDIEPALIYAVIQTESAFNPKAKSHIPAYGLMQLVPKFAGRDAYKLVYKKDKMVSANYLYKPEKNIELGAAYLHILKTRYFGKLKNNKSKTYCMIAAYNTGAGNVSKAFNGTTNIRKAIPKIDSMSDSRVYSTLKSKLPYDETKHYLDRVSSRMKLYASK